MLLKGPPREFSKSRHAQRRELHKACQAAVKGTPWRSNQGVVFRQRDGWFVAVQEMTKVHEERTTARLVVKPMAIDPIFWELIGHPELIEEPLSFRFFGWMKTACLILEEPTVPEDGGPPAIAARMIDLGERKLTQIASHWTADDFLEKLGHPTKPDQNFVTRIATLLAETRFDEAQALCDDSAARGQTGGFLSSSGGSFNEMVTRWIRDHRTVENPLGTG